MLDDQRRPNVLEVDLGVVAQNVARIRDYIGPGVQMFAALKCNAYGYGLCEVARTARRSGADGVAVVDRSDAVRLREAGIDGPLLVYPGSLLDENAVKAIERCDLTPTLTEMAEARALSRAATRKLKVAIKVDVGQERMGFLAEEAAAAVVEIGRLPNLEVAYVTSHPNVPKSGDSAYRAWQMARLKRMTEDLDRAGASQPRRLISSSRLLALTDDLTFDAVDPGQMLFGPLSREGDVPWPTPHRALRALRSKLIHVKQTDRREFVEFVPFAIRPGMRVGIIPIGSADGVESAHCGSVLIRGKRAPFVAASLEHSRIDITDIPDAAVGDDVVLIGRQGADSISPDDIVTARKLARLADIPIAIRETVPRRYYD